MADEPQGEARNDLGRAWRITAEALGPPGERHFQLLVDAERGTAVLWLEKEQLYQLGMAIKRLMATLEEAAGEETGLPSGEPLQENSFDFKVEQLALGHDDRRGLFLLLAHNMEDEEDAPPVLGCWATRQQMDVLSDRAFEVCAAGRPLCRLCGIPLNPGQEHMCPRSNGHGIPA